MDTNNFTSVLKNTGMAYGPVSIQTLWINITKRCNQSCFHCHVEANADSSEQMSRPTIEQCLQVLSELDSCTNLDITGGAPELHPDFDYIVTETRKLGKQITVRHNLTVTIDGDPHHEGSKEYLPYFFAENGVTILASLPHHDEETTDRVRGQGTFKKSIDAITKLNSLGYGQPDSGLMLNLVYNCDGPVSEKERSRLEAEYKEVLGHRYGLRFNSLLAVTNMPIGRFRPRLKAQGILEQYMGDLVKSFDPAAVSELVCRNLISVGHDGRLYDCDFNQMLGMEIAAPNKASIYNFDAPALLHRKIRFGAHCFGCTAGGGSR